MNATTPDQTEEFDATELGAMMREMRENLGHDLEKVAQDLRIRLVYLEAIEAGRLSDLPGNAYVSGFLRAYSDYLGLDGEEIVRRFKMAGAEISSKTQLHLPSPVEEGRLPTAFILLVAAIIAAGAYGGWYYVSSQGGDPMETVAKLPRELSGLVEGAANQTAPAQAQSDASAAATSQADAPPTQVPPTEAPAPETAEAAAPSTPAAMENDGDSAAGTGSDAGTESSATPVPSTQTEPSESAAAEVTDQAAEQVTEAAETTAAVPPATEPASPPAAESAQTAASPPPTANVEEPESPAVAPSSAAETAGSSVVPATSAPASAESETQVQASPPATAPPAETQSASEPEPPAQTAAVPSQPQPAPSRILPGSSTDTVRIVVRATADSYVAVRTADNEALFSQLMRPGDSYEVPSGADLLLETGNAGGLQITVGGKRVPPLGPSGEIRRNIPLDAEKLLGGLN